MPKIASLLCIPMFLAAIACSGGAGTSGGGFGGSGFAGSGGGLAATGGAGAGGSSGATATDSAHPAALFGTWSDNEYFPSFDGYEYTAYRFDADGRCAEKYDAKLAQDCTYDVATGGVPEPSPSKTWLIQMTFSDGRVSALEVVAINASQFTVRSDVLMTYKADDGSAVLNCVGTTPPCQDLDQTTCEKAFGCDYYEGCSTPSYLEHELNCPDLSPLDCLSRPGCSLG